MTSASEKTSLLSSENPSSSSQDMEMHTVTSSASNTGARPKIRNPKEPKRRFVMKQPKPSSKPLLLESVSETEEGPQQSLLSSNENSSTDNKHGKCSEFFGVRSYVHSFYEAMAMDDLQAYEDVGSHRYGCMRPARKRRFRQQCLKGCLWSGTVIIAFGLFALLTAFLVPKRDVVVGIQEDIEIINRANQAFNEELDTTKVIGIVMFCTGGCMIIGVLLYLSLKKQVRIEDPLSSEIIPIIEEQPPRTPTDIKVPATEEVTAVQPKRIDSDEVVMTNAGLYKIPPRE